MARLAHAFMEKYDVPALSFAVGYAGEIVHRDAFGLADRERNEAITPMHLFRIASVSKTITSTTIFGLIEQGRLKLADKLFGPGGITGTDYGRPPYNPGVNEITLGQLLTHTGGGWTNDSRDPMFGHPRMSQPELIGWTLSNRPLDNPPGQHYAYSNFGYCVLGRVIEKITGQPAVLQAENEFKSLFPDCAVGTMPPFGNLYGLTTYVDKSLTQEDFIVFEAGTHTDAIKLSYRDYERLANPRIEDLATKLHPIKRE